MTLRHKEKFTLGIEGKQYRLGDISLDTLVQIFYDPIKFGIINVSDTVPRLQSALADRGLIVGSTLTDYVREHPDLQIDIRKIDQY